MQATPCQDVDLDDMRAFSDSAGALFPFTSCTARPLSSRASGALHFDFPCRCGDRFTVAEAVRTPVLRLRKRL
jgi:hypothetical protein